MMSLDQGRDINGDWLAFIEANNVNTPREIGGSGIIGPDAAGTNFCWPIPVAKGDVVGPGGGEFLIGYLPCAMRITLAVFGRHVMTMCHRDLPLRGALLRAVKR